MEEWQTTASRHGAPGGQPSRELYRMKIFFPLYYAWDLVVFESSLLLLAFRPCGGRGFIRLS